MIRRALLTLALSAGGCATAPAPAIHASTPTFEPEGAAAEAAPPPVASSSGLHEAAAAPRAAPSAPVAPPEAATAPAPAPAHPANPPEVVVAEAPDPRPEAPWDPDAPVVFAPEVEAHVRAIAARVSRRRADVFVKVGDSATVSRIYLQCLSDEAAVRLDGRDELRPVLARFRAAAIGGGDSFSRDSLAAGVGWSANRPLRGSPTPLAQEVRAANPRFALVMFGSNDLELGRLRRYESRMDALVDRLLGWGVVPVLSTIPQRNDDPEADRDVPRYNRVVRALARERRLPLIDLNRALASLPDRGLASDGVHPSAPVVDGRADGCDFTEAGLQHGMNVRNLLALRVLGRLAEVLEERPDSQ